MVKISQIRQSIVETVRDDGERQLCLDLLSEIERRRLTAHRGVWTYQALSKWVNRSAVDPVFQDCVNYLATSPSAKALDLHFLFFDPADPDDIGTPVSDEDVALAFGKGVFIHPEKGEPVQNFKRTLVPYFTPAADLLREGPL